ncbi:ABC transporter ATP-binding protein [Photobacterium sp.]|uniref:ABC transporter ATP-binding protein n=1 Tax=Photobacterium sp. TaxID=660 RepID=UPI00299CF67B|nr:ABC transporter ATP-binding protein [Photobacterium sp.]MDX1302946.1 ABC transporter ATP-binding protein [Photobacterium sp.]
MTVAISAIPGVEVTLTHGQIHYHTSPFPLFANLSLTLPKGKWTCILGKSGCGKTSLLRLLAGLLDDKAQWQGEITTCDGKTPASQVAYMAQQDLLLPWLSVIENVCFSIRLMKGKPNADEKARALDLLHRVGLAEYASAYPDSLSGGMRQRVALARTLMQDKPLLLMDEPFSALDAVTRHKLQNLAAELLADKTVLLITHDPQEALRLGHQILLMTGTPAAVRSLPAPSSAPPRQFDAELATLQQKIIEQLEQDYG